MGNGAQFEVENGISARRGDGPFYHRIMICGPKDPATMVADTTEVAAK